ncbi:hypothetical protein Mhypo_03382 [Meiothermus hypogaeus]|uniref:Uncharacterized protein n=1 Tax=Meiothermus hypogaeus TaxID=884155 RepID=A0ABX9MH92_9DEIN|nr:hypothetical protein Mhypo_03382 [Meiothermus hypogaeus]
MDGYKEVFALGQSYALGQVGTLVGGKGGIAFAGQGDLHPGLLQQAAHPQGDLEVHRLLHHRPHGAWIGPAVPGIHHHRKTPSIGFDKAEGGVGGERAGVGIRAREVDHQALPIALQGCQGHGFITRAGGNALGGEQEQHGFVFVLLQYVTGQFGLIHKLDARRDTQARQGHAQRSPQGLNLVADPIGQIQHHPGKPRLVADANGGQVLTPDPAKEQQQKEQYGKI